MVLNNSPFLEKLCCDAVEYVPSEVLSKDYYDDCLPRLKSYLAELAEGETSETDIKLILLGNGRVGKTQLCRRLRNEEFERNSASTHGVQLWRQALELRKEDSTATFYANWWDFGGQDIYHSTHSLFLRSRAVFLILWALQVENSDEFEENGIPLRNQPLAYWLDYVRSLAGTSSPIIVVQSQCESFGAEKAPPVTAEGFNFARTCSFGAANDHGKETLEAHLRDAIRFLGEKNGPLLIGSGRARLRQQLYEMRDSDQHLPETQRLNRTLDRSAFELLCQEAGGIASADHALDYFHQTGVVFHQKDLFGGQIVLDQSWALEAVYSVYNRARALPHLRENGRFTRQDLEVLCWKGKSRDEQRLLIGMMESCGICFIYQYAQDGEHTYLAPDLLPSFERVENQLFAWNEDEATIALGLEYRFLHQALLRNVISRLGADVRENAVYWKYGLWLRTRSGTQLLVRQESRSTTDNPGAGCLWIAVQGPESAKLMETVRKRLSSFRSSRSPKNSCSSAAPPSHGVRSNPPLTARSGPSTARSWMPSLSPHSGAGAVKA